MENDNLGIDHRFSYQAIDHIDMGAKSIIIWKIKQNSFFIPLATPALFLRIRISLEIKNTDKK